MDRQHPTQPGSGSFDRAYLLPIRRGVAPEFLWQVAAKDFVKRTDTLPGGSGAAPARVGAARAEMLTAPIAPRRIGL